MATVIDLLRHLGQHAAPNGDNALAGPVVLSGVSDASLTLPLAPALVHAWSHAVGRATLGHHALALSAAHAGHSVALMGHGPAPHADLLLLSLSQLRFEHSTLWIVPDEAAALRATLIQLADQLQIRWVDAAQPGARVTQAHLVLSTPQNLHSRVLQFHDRAWRWLWPRLRFVVIPELQRFTTVRAGHLRWLLRRVTRLANSPLQVLSSLAPTANAEATLSRLLGEAPHIIAAPAGPTHATLAALWQSGPDRHGTMLRLAQQLETRRLAVAVLGRTASETEQLQKALHDAGMAAPADEPRVALVAGVPTTVEERHNLLRAGYRLVVLLAGDQPHEQLLAAQPELLLETLPRWPLATTNPFIAAAHLLCAAAERPLIEPEIDQWQMRELRDRLLRKGSLSTLPSGDQWQSAPTATEPYGDVVTDAIGGQPSTVYDPDGNAVGHISPALLDRCALPRQMFSPELRIARREDAAHRVQLVAEQQPRATFVQAEVQVTVREELAARTVRFGKVVGDLTRGKVLADQQVSGLHEYSTSGERSHHRLQTPAEMQWVAAACWISLPSQPLEQHGIGWAVQHALPFVILAQPGTLTVCYAADLQRLYLIEAEPGGVGIAESVYDEFERLLELAATIAAATATSPLFGRVARSEQMWIAALRSAQPVVQPIPSPVAASGSAAAPQPTRTATRPDTTALPATAKAVPAQIRQPVRETAAPLMPLRSAAAHVSPVQAAANPPAPPQPQSKPAAVAGATPGASTQADTTCSPLRPAPPSSAQLPARGEGEWQTPVGARGAIETLAAEPTGQAAIPAQVAQPAPSAATAEVTPCSADDHAVAPTPPTTAAPTPAPEPDPQNDTRPAAVPIRRAVVYAVSEPATVPREAAVTPTPDALTGAETTPTLDISTGMKELPAPLNAAAEHINIASEPLPADHIAEQASDTKLALPAELVADSVLPLEEASNDQQVSPPVQGSRAAPSLVIAHQSQPARYLLDDLLPPLNDELEAAEQDGQPLVQAGTSESNAQSFAEPSSVENDAPTPEQASIKNNDPPVQEQLPVDEANMEPIAEPESARLPQITPFRPPARPTRPGVGARGEPRPPLPFRRPSPPEKRFPPAEPNKAPESPATPARRPSAPAASQRQGQPEPAPRSGDQPPAGTGRPPQSPPGAARRPNDQGFEPRHANSYERPPQPNRTEPRPPGRSQPPTPEHGTRRDAGAAHRPNQDAARRGVPERDQGKQPRPETRSAPPAPEQPAANVNDMIARMRRLREQREAEQNQRRTPQVPQPRPQALPAELRFHIGERVQCLPYGIGVVQASKISDGREIVVVDFPEYGEIEVDPAVSLVRQLAPGSQQDDEARGE